ncbi:MULTISPECIES: hypothetical protein [Mesorhizobium]|uniref:hypothetical protein n=1 Tax=Mesorhizobium TaxID=68287 RepID=UPI0015558CCF|nr:hypothetical protein [Mesorhizobium sp. NZP2298]
MFDLPAGGLALWLRLRNGLSGETWAANAASAGLAITPGIRFALDPANAPEAFRFGYARHESRTSAHRSTAFAHAAEPIAVQLGREKKSCQSFQKVPRHLRHSAEFARPPCNTHSI